MVLFSGVQVIDNPALYGASLAKIGQYIVYLEYIQTIKYQLFTLQR